MSSFFLGPPRLYNVGWNIACITLFSPMFLVLTPCYKHDLHYLHNLCRRFGMNNSCLEIPLRLLQKNWSQTFLPHFPPMIPHDLGCSYHILPPIGQDYGPQTKVIDPKSHVRRFVNHIVGGNPTAKTSIFDYTNYLNYCDPRYLLPIHTNCLAIHWWRLERVGPTRQVMTTTSINMARFNFEFHTKINI